MGQLPFNCFAMKWGAKRNVRGFAPCLIILQFLII